MKLDLYLKSFLDNQGFLTIDYSIKFFIDKGLLWFYVYYNSITNLLYFFLQMFIDLMEKLNV